MGLTGRLLFSRRTRFHLRGVQEIQFEGRARVVGFPFRPYRQGVPVQLDGTEYEKDYWAFVALLHFRREGDPQMKVAELVKKYPYRRAKEIVTKGWKG